MQSPELNIVLHRVDQFLFEPPMGQLRRDCLHQKFTIVSFMLGASGDTLNSDEKFRLKAKVIHDIYLNNETQNQIYTISGTYYLDFLRDVFHGRFEIAWLCTGPSLKRVEVYEGPLDKLLDVLELGWGEPYEWTLTSDACLWAVDYNHHKSMVIVGDNEVNRANNRLGRNKWRPVCIQKHLYPRQN